MVRSKGEKGYRLCIHIILSLVSLSMILPVLLLFIGSVTDEQLLIESGYTFFPKRLSLEGYRCLWQNIETVGRALLISLGVTAVGTACSVCLTLLLAYPLTVRRLPGRKLLHLFVLIPMLFSGGLVPAYVMWSTVFPIKNTLFAYLVPNLLLRVWWVLLTKNYLERNVSAVYCDAARIDGMGHWGVLREIVLPAGKPVLTAISVFTAIGYWNDWLNGLYYVYRTSRFSLPVLLCHMSVHVDAIALHAEHVGWASDTGPYSTLSLHMAMAFLLILPVLLVYPFIWKPLVSGLTLGTMKK